jgi:hypothetical protein
MHRNFGILHRTLCAPTNIRVPPVNIRDNIVT